MQNILYDYYEVCEQIKMLTIKKNDIREKLKLFEDGYKNGSFKLKIETNQGRVNFKEIYENFKDEIDVDIEDYRYKDITTIKVVK